MLQDKKALINQLKKDMLLWQGFRPADSHKSRIGLGVIEEAFPNGIFPKGSIHEFISTSREESASSCGFISFLLSKLMKNKGVCIWISSFKSLFPISLESFGIKTEHIVFVNMKLETDILWAMEEALKCQGITSVVAEIHKIDYTQIRRLQLAVEKSSTVGVLLRHQPRTLNSTACAARWRIKPISSHNPEDLPGIGFPCWDIHLEKVRNGTPGRWKMLYSNQTLHPIIKKSISQLSHSKIHQTG